MASSSKDGDDPAEYESDTEDSLLPAMRRREASDDEDGDGDGDAPLARKQLIGSDADSDGQGAAQVYDDDVDYEDELDEELEELEEEEIEGDGVEVEHLEGSAAGGGVSNDGERGGAEDEPHEAMDPRDKNEDNNDEPHVEEQKKGNEPFAVPTAGAFYMHDDRFRDNGRGRNRRFPGGRRLWESKDDRAWVHDRFEELNFQDSRYEEEGRMSRGRFRGRGGGKVRGAGRGYARGNKPRLYDNNNKQNHVPKSVRGRGPRRYEAFHKDRSEMHASSNKQYSKLQESPSNGNSSRASGQVKQPLNSSNMQPDPVPPRKHISASNLSSASPPFYPSGSSNQDIHETQKKDGNMRTNNRIHPSPVQLEEKLPTSQSIPSQSEKITSDSSVHDRIYVDDVLRPLPGKAFASSFSKAPLSSLSLANSRVSPSRVSANFRPGYRPSGPFNQLTLASLQAQSAVAQPQPYQPQGQSPLRIPAQQMSQRPGSTAQAPTQALSTNSSEVGEAKSPPSSGKSESTLTGKEQIIGHGAGRGSFLYNGSQVMGATAPMGFTPGDQGFPGMPALLPVMQFDGQPGGPGVPTVGMALPGYVAQPQLGFGNSEMTWLPVLAGAAGALGASYPYITLDGSNCPQPSGQASFALSRDTSSEKPNNTLRLPVKSDIGNTEFGQRQNKPRRYSEMNFGL